MPLEPIVWIIGLGLLVLLILVVNDKTKPKRSPQDTPQGTDGSFPGGWIGVLIVIGLVVLGLVYGRDIPRGRVWLLALLFPLVLASIVLFAMLFTLRKIIWFYLKTFALTGRFPRVMRTNADGQTEINCPRCSGKTLVTKWQKGETAFECPHCGEKATWLTETRPHSAGEDSPEMRERP
jgi:hypothetical protein